MKFLILIPSVSRGGVEEYALKVASEASRRGWDVHVAFPSTEQTVSLIKDFELNGVHYYHLAIAEQSISGLRYTLSLLPRLVRTLFLLLQLKPDVVQIIPPWFNRCLGSILACALLNIPTMVRFGLIPSHPISMSKPLLKFYAWARMRNQRWVAVSDHDLQLLCKTFRIAPEEMVRIYNGTTATCLTGQSEHIQALRHQVLQELQLSPDNIIALTVARLAPEKGYSVLIPTIPHITSEFPEIRFVWVGDGPQRHQLQQLLQEYGIADKVLLLGHLSDVSRLLQVADLFVFPTRLEGHPSALLEAMAHGRAIVASQVCSIPEMMNHCVHGLLFRANDSCDLLETLRQALRNPNQMQEMAKNAQLRAQQFSKQKMFDETFSVLESFKTQL